jgi:hypothetical protein
MREIWLALVGGAVVQNSEMCAKTSGGIHIITSGPRQFRWYFPSDMLTARFNDCVARRAALAPQLSPQTPSKRSRRVSQ